MNFLPQWIGAVLILMPMPFNWISRAPLPEPRAGYAAGVVHGRLIIAGGSEWMGDKKIQTAATDAYDQECNCWSKMASLPEALSDAESVTVGGTLYVLGGASGARGLRQVYSFDGTQWTLQAQMELPEPRLLGAAVTDGQRIFLLGGISKPGDYTTGLETFWSIDLKNIKAGWSPLPACPAAARASFGAVFREDRILVIGGYEADKALRGNLSDIWAFDTTSRQWTREGSLPEGRRAMAAVAACGRVWLLGGFTSEFRADVLVLKGSGAARVGTLPHPVADAGFFEIGPRWYTTGGEIKAHVRGSQTWSATLSWPAAENSL